MQRRARSAGSIVERQPAVVEAAVERSPARPHVAERGGELGLRRVSSAQAASSAAIGFDRFWRSRQR